MDGIQAINDYQSVENSDKYVPIFLDWIEVTCALSAQEKGRLIDAIVLYARGGNHQDRIKGNERYIFPSFQSQIDKYMKG